MPNSPIDFYQVSLKLVLQNSEGKILVMPTPPERGQGGKFDIPGGRIDENEFEVPFEKIIRREIIEELGNDVKIDISADPFAVSRNKITVSSDPSILRKDIHILFVFYKGILHEGKITIDDEHTGFEWIDPRDNKYRESFINGIYSAIQSYVLREEGAAFETAPIIQA